MAMIKCEKKKKGKSMAACDHKRTTTMDTDLDEWYWSDPAHVHAGQARDVESQVGAGVTTTGVA